MAEIRRPRSHPAFYSLPEQWEGWTQQVTGLKKRFAFVKHPSGKTVKIQSLPLPDPVVDPGRLATIEAHYLRTGFRQVSISPTPGSVVFKRKHADLPAGQIRTRLRWDVEE